MAIIRPNKTLILGNGFDLDLGLHTTYADFAASKFWPLEDQSSEERRKITFFTKDELSQRQLMSNIYALNKTSYDNFRDLNDVSFIRTKDVVQEDIDEFFEHLVKTT